MGGETLLRTARCTGMKTGSHVQKLPPIKVEENLPSVSSPCHAE